MPLLDSVSVFLLFVFLLTPRPPPAANAIESALHFYKALKVYPTPGDLIRIYDQTVSKVSSFPQEQCLEATLTPQSILDILAEMIAVDSELNIRDIAPPITSLGLDSIVPVSLD